MLKSITQKIEQYKNFEKDDAKTIEVVGRYCEHGVSDLEELFMNLTTGVNAYLINYELAEQEFNRIRNYVNDNILDDNRRIKDITCDEDMTNEELVC